MQTPDAQLIELSLAGDHGAFGTLVDRYQNLVCAVALGQTGNLAKSEELAQEAFLTAWKSLGKLSHPGQLRPWLCGIVRNLARNQNRQKQTDLLEMAGPIENAASESLQGPGPLEVEIQKEERELLERTLSSIETSYREPLVLFYRQGQSVREVSEALNLSIDAVKKRLERGRQMLRTEVAAAVERGLLQSKPGRAFTLGVLASLPAMTGTAKAASLTAGAAKGAAMIPVSAAGLGALGGVLGGGVGVWMSLRNARSERERQWMIKLTAILLVGIAAFGLGITALVVWGKAWFVGHPVRLAIAILVGILAYVGFLLAAILFGNRRISEIRREIHGEESTSMKDPNPAPAPITPHTHSKKTYQSRAHFLGLPLVRIDHSGMDEQGNWPAPVRAWIAVGHRAQGVLLAMGGFAVGGVAIGGLSIGIVSISGVALGVFAVGGVAAGSWAVGGFALGIHAVGGLALGWKGALGGLAVAHEFAEGGKAIAAEANTPAAKEFFADRSFYQTALAATATKYMTLLTVVCWAPLVISLMRRSKKGYPGDR